ncbi:glycoside hydrolase family 16 protein [Autumnicola edwardsiae]|uniref:Glycoside hydrolase family 16 protein n=1 Tax=Autumnicola edwardsiae TaxID=3075594 RepID=A0ABU3D0G1_9FLAO|nr:glycoside hydrolase family 16 protein [Zunongwangia sp. F297]MDT0651897.1 glycoside hydrolase family 16 protein [Zunongwangia sp. F297]
MNNMIRNKITGLLFLMIPVLINAQEMIFEENFDGDELNMDNWSYEEGDGCPDLCGWGNNERQIYNRDYVSVEDGNLVIEAVKEGDKYYSGKIISKDKVEFQYGEIEVRVNVPEGQGIWPAFWMLGHDINEVSWPASGEIDIMEYVGREPNTVYTTLHYPAHHGENASSKKTNIDNIEDGYHIFKTVWTADNIEFFVDGTSVYNFIPEKYDAEHYPFRKPFYFLINMAVGGNFGGPEVDDSIFPKKYYVDYIKVTALDE